MNTKDAQAELDHSPWKKVFYFPIVVTILVALIVLAFTWPTKTSEPKDLPIGITGPAASVVQTEEALEANAEGVFDFHIVGDRAAAEQQIKEREIYGAIILNEGAAPEVLTAPAANAGVAQMLNGVAQQMSMHARTAALEGQKAQLQAAIDAGGEGAEPALQQMAQLDAQIQAQQAMTATVTPVVSLSEDDPNGSAFSVSAFPLVLGGMLGGMMTMFSLKGVWRRLTAARIYAILGGLVVTLILHSWFGFVGGSFGAVWGTLMLSITGTAFFILGISSILGNGAGAAIGAGLTMLFANPLSGAAAPWQYTPGPWGLLGQHMIPGASTSLLRSISYFPDAPVAREVTIMILWVLFGLLLNFIGLVMAKRKVAASVRAAENHERIREEARQEVHEQYLGSSVRAEVS